MSKLESVPNSTKYSRIVNRYEFCGTKIKRKFVALRENKIVPGESPKSQQRGKVLLNIAKNMKKSLNNFVNKYFTEDGRSKLIGEKPLKGKELEKFISDTEMYDPNSYSYTHANYSVNKKGS